MSLMVSNSNVRESSTVTKAGNKQIEREENVFVKGLSANQASKTEQTEKMSPEEELAVFKKEFYEELSQINNHRTVSNMAINISEDAFKKMKEDPEYKEQILNLIKRDWGDSYAPRNASVLITVGSSLNDYRADSWPVIADSEFDMRSQDSYYKKLRKSKKDKQKELLEEYLQKRWETKRFEQKLLNEKKIKTENRMQDALRKSDAEKAYNNQILYTE